MSGARNRTLLPSIMVSASNNKAHLAGWAASLVSGDGAQRRRRRMARPVAPSAIGDGIVVANIAAPSCPVAVSIINGSPSKSWLSIVDCRKRGAR
jgi:hypothetical protein